MTYLEVLEFLRVERLRRRITQMDLATKAGLSQETIGRCERVSRKWSITAVNLFTWIEALDLEIVLVPREKKNGE